MTEEIRQLLDLDDNSLSQVPFGRNRFLRTLGVVLFGFAVQLVAPGSARAYHGNPPYPVGVMGNATIAVARPVVT